MPNVNISPNAVYDDGTHVQPVRTGADLLFDVLNGSTSASGTLTLNSTSHATKGAITLNHSTLTANASSYSDAFFIKADGGLGFGTSTPGATWDFYRSNSGSTATLQAQNFAGGSNSDMQIIVSAGDATMKTAQFRFNNFTDSAGAGGSLNWSDSGNNVLATIKSPTYSADTDKGAITLKAGSFGSDTVLDGDIYINTTLIGLTAMVATTGVSATAVFIDGTPNNGTFYFKVSPIDMAGREGIASSEVSVTLSEGVPTDTARITWSATTGAASYRIYKGTSAGAENTYYTTTALTYDWNGGAGTAGTPKTVNQGYQNIFNQSGYTYFNAGNVNIGTTTAQNYKLYVGGTSYFSGILQAAANIKLTGGTYIYPSANSTTSMAFSNASGTRILTVDTSNSRVGIGASITPSATLHVGGNIMLTAGSKIVPATNSTTALGIGNASATTYVNFDTTNSRVGIGNTAPATQLDIFANVAVTPDDTKGLGLINTTAATVGAQKYSPAIRWRGFGWKTGGTAASRSTDWRSFVVPVQGASNPASYLTFQNSTNGGAYADILVIKYTPDGLASLDKLVGINTTTPAQALDVNGGLITGGTYGQSAPVTLDLSWDGVSANQAYSKWTWNDGGGGVSTAYLGLDNIFGTGDLFIQGQTISTGYTILESYGGAGLALSTGNGNLPILFHINRTEYMRLDSVGRLGIGTTTPTSNLQVSGSVALTYVEKTATYTLSSSDYTVNCTSGTFTLNLPTAVGIQGRVYVIKNSGAGTITIDPNGAQLIDGAATLALATTTKVMIQSTNAGWITI